MFINSYEEVEVAIAGKLIGDDNYQEFKTKVIEITEESMEYAEDEYLAKGNVFLDNIGFITKTGTL